MMDRNIAKFVSCLVLLLIAYFPTLAWMLDRWFEKESYYGHGFLIPLVSLFIVWQRRGALRGKVERGTWNVGRGLWIAGCGLIIHIICAALKVYFISGFSFVFALYGLVLFFFGTETARKLAFPIFFLFAMIPLPLVLIGNLTVKLKLFATAVSTFVLNRIGFPSRYNGNIIIMPRSYTVIDAPCSGLRSLISLLTLGLLFAYATKMSYGKRIALFLSSVPIALGTNIIRILLLATVNDLYGEEVAMGFVHDASGFLVFAIAFMALYGVGSALKSE